MDRRTFHVEIIKPSHYDDDGYVIQWLRAFIPSNSLACVHALCEDAGRRRVLGDDVDVAVNAYDESHTVIPVRDIIRRTANGRGMVMLCGVQTNQFPRAADLAREFRAAGVPVCVGGFHVSGCLAMLPELPPDIRDVQAQGVSLFAGEAEGRIDQVLRDAHRGELRPIYNYLNDLPELTGAVVPSLPPAVVKKYIGLAPFDAGRGCPFNCSFCTIINVQGRKSRYRTADDVEQIVRDNVARGTHKFFITDDDFARNKNWEPIFDRLIHLREAEGLKFDFLLQVDTQCHKIPRFIEKAGRAGCTRVFIGLENINAANLAAANKKQNHVGEYRKMLLAWRKQRVLIIAGYILGFPADTPESIAQDIQTIQRELPIDILEFFCLTPLPGSADHQALHRRGAWMEPDMNNYDLEHVTTRHGRMTAAEWRDVYHRAWGLFYTPAHVATLLRRARACGAGSAHVAAAIQLYYGSYVFQKVHPLQCGFGRRKVRSTRRPGLPRESRLLYPLKRAWETLTTHLRMADSYLWLRRLRQRIQREPRTYIDAALTPEPTAAPTATKPATPVELAAV